MLTPQQLAILSELRQDSRIALAEISRKTGLASSTVFDQYKRLAEGTIRRHVSLPDFAKLGYPLRKHFLLRAKERKDALEWLRQQRCVNNLYRVDLYAASFDAYFKDVQELEEFKSALKNAVGPRTIEEYDILEALKEEAFIPSRLQA